MKLLAIGVLILVLTPVPFVYAQNTSNPPWFFQGAYLNYTNVLIQNSSVHKIVNVSYKIIEVSGSRFTYMVIPGELTSSNYTVEASLDHLNGFPALNSTQISMLNRGNASFMKIIRLPFTEVNITVKTGVMAYTSEGVVSSDLVVTRVTSKLDRSLYEITYTNYSTYSGVLLNMKIKFGNETKYVSNLVSTNVPLGILTWPQIIAEFFGVILIVIIVVYMLRRYRKARIR